MLLHLSSHSAEPLRSQILRQLRARIEAGDVPSGQPLPSSHQLASRLRVPAAALDAACRDLEREGLVTLGSDGLFRVTSDASGRPSSVDEWGWEVAGDRQPTRHELQLAREIQCRLLPPPRVVGPGFEVLTRIVPARVLAGDLCDVLRHPDGSVGVMAADVAGKGVAASLVMASVKATFPFLAADNDVPGTLRALGHRLSEELGRRQFVALAYARFDPATSEVTIANAGLPDPLVLRRGEPPFAVEVPGPRLPLGARSDVSYQSRRLTLGSGERLLLYTDGLPETRLAEGEVLGFDAFTRLVAAVPHPDGEGADEDWLDALLARVLELGGVAPDDDCTLALLARRPAVGKEG